MKNNHVIDNNRPNCELGIRVGQDSLFVALDQVDVLIGVDDDTEEQVVTLLAAADIATDDTPYLVRCEPTDANGCNLTFRDRSLVATQVATLTTPG
jgi:hypothetical protein